VADNISALPEGYRIDQMTRTEADILDSWAAAEGWNPGLHDIDIAWSYDPDAFIALRKDDELAGGGAIISYEGAAGFMGLFIMRADLRRQGLGRILWHERLRRLRARLRPDAPIGMDGVFEMAPFYEAGGFQYLYRDLRFEGTAQGARDPAAVPLDQVPWPDLAAYDTQLSGLRREGFIRAWLGQKGGHGFTLREAGAIAGYGYLRPCRVGFKLGPLYASDAAIARRLLLSLLSAAQGSRVQIDVPEPNLAAIELMNELGWRNTFGCARMVHGTPPVVLVGQVFGVTSFEFG
jgi:hypothetical protein